MARAGDVDHVQVVFLDDPVQMDMEEVQTGCRAPVAEHETSVSHGSSFFYTSNAVFRKNRRLED